MTRTNFEVSLLKGEIGERIMRPFFEQKGWCVYRAVTDCAHAFDGLAIHSQRDAIAYDVKAKSRMNHYPATGINQKNYETYLAFKDKHQMPFWLFFIDECLGQIYGNEIGVLDQPRVVEGRKYPFVMQPRNSQPIRIWPLTSMEVVACLTELERAALEACNQRKHAYDIKHDACLSSTQFRLF